MAHWNENVSLGPKKTLEDHTQALEETERLLRLVMRRLNELTHRVEALEPPPAP